jgi:hypothetical protein
VCNKCYNAISGLSKALSQDAVLSEVFGSSITSNPVETSETKYGLQQITLGLCMGAMTESDFSAERDPSRSADQQAAGAFVRDSLASRVLAALRHHNLRGIRVSASNQVVTSTEQGIRNVCGVDYPTDIQPDKKRPGQTIDKEELGLNAQTSTFDIPAYIYGSRKTLVTEYQGIAKNRSAGQVTASGNLFPKFTDGITVSPCGRSLHFSEGETDRDLDYVHRFFLNHWRFTSWQISRYPLLQLPAGSATKRTWKITAPPRVTRLEFVQATSKNSIKITGRAEDSFKQYKSYEVS